MQNQFMELFSFLHMKLQQHEDLNTAASRLKIDCNVFFGRILLRRYFCKSNLKREFLKVL